MFTTRCGRAAANACEPLVLEAEGLYAEYSFVTRIQAGARGQRCDSRRRRVGLDQRPHEAGGASERPAVSFGGDGRLDGRLHGVRRIDHARRLEANVRLPGAAGRGGRFGSHCRRAGGAQRLGLRRPGREVPAGADWLLADCLGIDAIDREIWEMVQSRLRRVDERSGRRSHAAIWKSLAG